MSYQSRKRWCRKCLREEFHWRELPDTPRRMVELLEDFPYILWKHLTTPWTCRRCKGVPSGPIRVKP